MGKQFSLPAQLPPVSLLVPAADAAGRTGAYRNLRNALKAYIIARVYQGNAATVALTPLQATDNQGTNSKAIAAVPIWADLDTSSSDALVAKTAAASFTTDAATKDKIVVFEIDPDTALDVAGGFSFITLQTGASNAANLTEATLLILGSYAQATPPSAY